jgi:hypothetical protein
MMLRHVRKLFIGLFTISAIAAAPSRSQADITIQIQEVDSKGNPVGSAQTFASSPGGTFLPITGANPTASFLITSVSSTLLNSTSSNTASTFLSTTMNLGLQPGYISGDSLQISVQATSIANPYPNGSASVINQPSANNTSLPGTISVSSSSDVNGVVTNNALATATQTGNSGTSTTAIIDSLPGTFSIYQTILASVQPNGTISSSNPFGAGNQSTVTVNAAVPAPGGLLLGLVGLPLIGMRRILRGKSSVGK